MKPKVAVVTTFNKKLYNYYAKNFCHSYNWNYDCYIYHEGWVPTEYKDKFIWRNIHETNPELKDFIERNTSRNTFSTDKDDTSKIIHGLNYRMDAIRFCYKVFAKTHLLLEGNYDYVFWIDADTVFVNQQPTPATIVTKLLPIDSCISYLKRVNYYPECGFVGYNLTKPATKRFVYKLREQYTKDLLFKEKEWHDSYIWDCVRKKWLIGEPQHNLSLVEGRGHIWMSSQLQPYINHYKGLKFKDQLSLKAKGI